MTFTLERFSDLLGTPEQIEINTLEDLCILCEQENHKIIFDARDKKLIVWDAAVFCYDDCDDIEFCE
ncbi:hypothetical protein [Eubacterium maltosivorans]|uniref:hypothetical protein n=1 Tax=Eubacterium maltosivorans TaxID=2041044 RepID=UPI00189D60F1|nr:hypothetical protein [Eubacterium maltosivorans]